VLQLVQVPSHGPSRRLVRHLDHGARVALLSSVDERLGADLLNQSIKVGDGEGREGSCGADRKSIDK